MLDLNAFLEDLKGLCAIDSGHANAAGTNAMADFYEKRYRALGLQVERRYDQGNQAAPFLLARNSNDEEIDVLFVAHMDTVFPVGTGAEWPFTVDKAGIAHGPGCVDCKSGGLMIYYLLRGMMDDDACRFRFCVAMNSDEETGSCYSRRYFEELAEHTRYCLICEPGRANDEFVGCRKGGANYLLKCYGISAHSGVEPEKGASAILELARWINELYRLTDYEKGTTLNVGRFDGGGDNGAVPDYAECTLSFRYLEQTALQELNALFERMRTQPFDSRTRVEIEEKSLRPAMEPHAATRALLRELEEAGKQVGQEVRWLTTGGGSDGNFISYHGVATLDGCGPCGAGLHTREEYLKIRTISERMELLRCLLERLFPKEGLRKA